jgi:hypothetical protein
VSLAGWLRVTGSSREGFAIALAGWQSCFALLMRLGYSGLRPIIGIGDSLKLSVVFPSLNKNGDFGSKGGISESC